MLFRLALNIHKDDVVHRLPRQTYSYLADKVDHNEFHCVDLLVEDQNVLSYEIN